MPSEQSTWLISVPHDGDSEGLLHELNEKLVKGSRSVGSPRDLTEFPIPSFKTGTLDSLVTLSEDLPKQDTYFTSVVAKIVEILRNLLNNDPSKLTQHTLVDERTIDDYLLIDWRWNDGRYRVEKSLQEIVAQLNKELSSIDNVMKMKLNNYNQAKGNLVQLQRKRAGNLAVRSLVEIVSKDNLIQDSEYLETVLVAVPKSITKEWTSKYERLASMVVPRSSQLIAQDEDYNLFGVVIFKRVHDEFAQKCRENKFTVRDFSFSDDQALKQQEELSGAVDMERELWIELLRISRTNFSESFQLLVHLKVIRLFVESVLRYGLPAEYTGIAIKPDPRQTKKALITLSKHFEYLAPRSNNRRAKGKVEGEEFAGEFQALMEQEFYDFVTFDVPWVVD